MATPKNNLLLKILGRSTPFRAMRTKPDARMLRDGELKLAQNMRWDFGVGKVRNGSNALTAAVPSGMTPGTRPFAGALECSLNNTPQAFVAWYGSISAANKACVYEVSTGTQTEITAASGQYGNTRFVGTGNNPIQMCAVRDEKSGLDLLVMQAPGTTEYPRVYSKSTGLTAIHQPVTAPIDGGLAATSMSWKNFFLVSGASMPTYAHTGTGTHLNIASNGSSPDNNVRLTRDATADATPATATMTFGTTRDLSTDRQLCFVFDQGTYPFWFVYLKIEIHDTGGTYSTIYDGQDTTGKYEARFSPMDTSSNRVAVAFSLDAIAAADRNVVDAIRFTWNHTTAKPSSTVNLDILCCAGSGKVSGLSKHCASYVNSGSYAESIAMYPATQTAIQIGAIGGRPYPDVRIPIQAYFYYSYDVFYLNTDATQLALGVDTLRLYRMDYAETQYTLVTEIATASYSGSWSLTSGTAGSQLTYTDNNAPSSRSLWVTPPRRNHVCLPRGGAMVASNGRLFTATYAPNVTAGSGGLTELMGSEFRFPFRFRYGLISSDAAQPSRTSYPGESIQALVATSLSGGNVASIYALTDRSMNVLDGLDAYALSLRKRVCPFGTLSPRCYAESIGRIFWLDQLMQVRVLDQGGVHNLSLVHVDDKLQAIAQSGSGGSQVLYTAMAFSQEKLYLGFSTDGVSNGYCLVYDVTLDAWISLDVPPSGITFEGFLRDVNPTGTRIPLLVLSSDQKAYRYDMPGVTLDLGANIAIQIQSRDFVAADYWGEDTALFVNRIRVECDDATSGTFTTLATFRPSGSTREGSISVDVSTVRAFRYDDTRSFVMKDSAGLTEAGGGNPVLNGNAVTVLLTASLPGGTNIYDIAIEALERDGVADTGAT